MLLTFQEPIIQNKAKRLVLGDDFGQDTTDLMAMIVGLRSVCPYGSQFQQLKISWGIYILIV